MTVMILCLDGLDWRLANDVDLFRETPLEADLLANDLEGEYRRFTPRVWTSIMAGQDQTDVVGWQDPATWQESTRRMTFPWEMWPGTRVHDLKVHHRGLTRSDVFPDQFAGSTQSMEALRDTAQARAAYLEAELQDTDAPAVIAWFGIADRAGHLAGKEGRDLTPQYRWMRDDLLANLALPSDTVVVSDHGFRRPDGDWSGSWAGRDAHVDTGVLATSDSMASLREFGTLSAFIPNWLDTVAGRILKRNLNDLGY